MNAINPQKTIILIQWSGSSYDSLNHLQNILGDEFQNLGFKIEKVSIDQPNFESHLISILKTGEVEFATGFSGIGVDLYLQGTSIWELFKTPLFNWCCDHPCYYPTRHAIKNPWLLHGFVFPDHAKISSNFFNPNGITFQAHLGAPSLSLDVNNIQISSKRNNKIIYSKSGTDINAIEERWEKTPSTIRYILFAAKEELLYQCTENVFDVINRIANDKNLYFSFTNELAINLIRELDVYIRGWRADLTLKALLNYPVDVFGNGWNHINWSSAKAATYHGPKDLQTILKIFPEYLGCLSINPFIQDSVHDRVFYSIANNVVPISDSNRFSQLQMPLLEKFAFHFQESSIISAIETLLENPSHGLEQTKLTQKNLEKDFSIHQSARQIITFVSLQKFNFKY